MKIETITSLQHPLIKHWVDLRKDKAYRDAHKYLLLIGEKMIREYPFAIRRIATTKELDVSAEEVYFVTEEMLKKVTGLNSFHGWIAEVAMPKPQNLDDKKFVLILDQIQDPGNLGTLLRSCLAFGWDGVIATPGTVDFFNDKALRASRGAIFHLPYSWMDRQEILNWVRNGKRTLWVADMKGEALEDATFSFPLALILSHEGQGVGKWAEKERRISIPLQRGVESLNVAAAGAVLLYEMR